MYKILGWVNFAVLLIMFLPIMLEKMNTSVLKVKGNGYTRALGFIRKLHKPLGTIIFVSVVIHGFLALGSFRLHTGPFLGLLLILTGIFAIAFAKAKKKWLFVTHKTLSYLFIIMMIIHLIFPSAFSALFGI